MSDGHDGGGRRRRSKRGLAAYWPWIAVAVVVSLLVANLVLSLSGGASDGANGGASSGVRAGFLDGLFSEDRLVQVGLWVALLPAAVAGVFGVYWASEAFSRSERPISLWMRRAFVVSLSSWIALIIVIMDADAFESRISVGIAAAAFFSVQIIPFAIAARTASEGRFGARSPGDGGSGGRRRRSSSGRSEENQQ